MATVLSNSSTLIFESTGDEDDTYMYSSDEDTIHSSDDEEEIFLKETRKFKKKAGYYYDRHGAMIVRRRHTPWKISKRVAVTSSTLHPHRRIPKQVDYWCAFPLLKQVLTGSDVAIIQSLPIEFKHKALNMAAMERARERLNKGWELLHHALQPCSVCGMLLSVTVDEKGDIVSSGRINPYDVFPTQPATTVSKANIMAWTLVHISRCYYLHCTQRDHEFTIAEQIHHHQIMQNFQTFPLPESIVGQFKSWRVFHR